MGNPKLQYYTTIRPTFKQQQKWTEIPYVLFMALHQNPNLWGKYHIYYAHIPPGPPSQEPDTVDKPLLGGSPPPRVPTPLPSAPPPPEMIFLKKPLPLRLLQHQLLVNPDICASLGRAVLPG